VLVPLLASSATVVCPVRVVLTVRAKQPGKPWTNALSGSGDAFDARLVRAEVDVLSERRLEGAARAELFRAANKAFVGFRSGGTASAAPVSAALEADLYSSPLMVVIAAYLAAVGDVAAAPTTRDELLDAVLVHEDHYWKRTAASSAVTVDDVQRRRVVALAALAGADSEEEAEELVRSVRDFSDAPAKLRGELARFANQLYPGERYWDQLGPDVVAEHLVATTFSNDPHLLAAVLADRPTGSVTRTVRLLARTAASHPALVRGPDPALNTALSAALGSLCQAAVAQVATETSVDRLLHGVMLAPALTALVQASEPGFEAATAALAVLPSRSDIALGGLATALTRCVVGHLRRLAETRPATYLPHLAMWLHNWSRRLGDVGRRDESVDTAKEAVEIYRRMAEGNLAADRPSRWRLRRRGVDYRPHLARSLNNLSIRLGETGQRGEGLAAVRESVEIRRRLTRANSAAYLPDLAESLNNLSVDLGDAGESEEGLASAREAVRIYRRVTKADPVAHLPELAKSLSNLSVRLGEAGRSDEGLAAVREAVEVHLRLSKDNPAAHLPDVVASLNNLSVRLGEAGRSDEGLAAAREAVDISRQLVGVSPAAHLPDLAEWLDTLSARLGEAGRSDEGLAAAREAVDIRRGLAETSPVAYLPKLAESLDTLSSRLGEAGQFAQAAAAKEEADKIAVQWRPSSPCHRTERSLTSAPGCTPRGPKVRRAALDRRTT
jgi:hypothetical protein